MQIDVDANEEHFLLYYAMDVIYISMSGEAFTKCSYDRQSIDGATEIPPPCRLFITRPPSFVPSMPSARIQDDRRLE